MPRPMFTRVAIAIVALLILLPRTSQAVNTLVLTDPAPADQQYQQTANSPCVIGDPSCKEPVGWPGESLIPPNTSPYNVGGDVQYTVAQIEAAILGTAFIIGIDVNTATGGDLATEFLDFFGVYLNGVLTWAYDPASPGHNLHNTNNGNGYADALLGNVDLSGLLSTDILTFRAIVNSATDGREEFFLINTSSPPPVVPEPASLLLLGTGFAGIAASARKRWKKR